MRTKIWNNRREIVLFVFLVGAWVWGSWMDGPVL